MQKLIGIRGHRGAGKDSVAYLIGCTLGFIDESERLEIKSQEDYIKHFNIMYNDAVKALVDNKEQAFGEFDWDRVYFDSFGDAPKVMIQQLLGCEPKYVWDEYWKDHAVVNLRTFHIEEVDELPEDLIDPSTMMSYCPSFLERSEDPCKMSMRDFILYFGQSVMQKYFGQDVWVKSTAMNDKMNEEYFEDGIRIYTDIKAPTELTYLIDKHAVIINVERRGYKKRGGLDLLKDDTRWDYNVQIKGNDLMSIKDDILKIAENIYWDNGKENN
jgi:hypothetical protein